MSVVLCLCSSASQIHAMTVQKNNSSHSPLDFSFRDITDADGIYFARRRKNLIPLTLEENASFKPLPEYDNDMEVDEYTYYNTNCNKKRVVTYSVKLNNNALSSLENVFQAIDWHIAFDVSHLKSLDLSFNQCRARLLKAFGVTHHLLKFF